ncbi:3'-5' exonuclease [Burkholderiales bacterium 8X]|nr:3'-5' exonuclease [Burkholderiales bacterium 8X]
MTTSPAVASGQRAPTALPERDQIALLPPFEGLDLPDIHVVDSAERAAMALSSLMQAGAVGFDTESKPTFAKNEVSQGPHLLQFATHDAAWLFQLHRSEFHDVLATLLAAPELVKAGFGLSSDLKLIRERFGIEPRAVVDIDHEFRRQGYRKSVGVKTAVALMFGRRLAKSRKATTSNWASRQLTPAQLRYAANDAYAAICLYSALGLGSPREPALRTTAPGPTGWAA